MLWSSLKSNELFPRRQGANHIYIAILCGLLEMAGYKQGTFEIFGVQYRLPRRRMRRRTRRTKAYLLHNPSRVLACQNLFLKVTHEAWKERLRAEAKKRTVSLPLVQNQP
mmetsp:Transcript_103710/g.189942  ORF Transcript_103710/g.189942 Transcript_103710/m.189942 type:complete len:110 (-) Transcript_103710:225-554(-)